MCRSSSWGNLLSFPWGFPHIVALVLVLQHGTSPISKSGGHGWDRSLDHKGEAAVIISLISQCIALVFVRPCQTLTT